MRQSFIFLITFVLANELFAQNVVVQPPKRIQSRSVSGIVQDSTDTVLSGAIVTLTSKIDTLKTRTNDEGLFFFKDVKAWEFTLSGERMFKEDGMKQGRGFSLDSFLHSDYLNRLKTIERINTPDVDDFCVIRSWVYKLLKSDIDELFKENGEYI